MGVSIEEKGDKIIAHNYGHGGSGWTLAPGSAAYVNNLLLQSKYSAQIDQNTPITIVGAGALGLFTAYDLSQRGFSNITVVAERFEPLVSHKAGGLLAPVSMDNDTDMQKVIDQIGLDAYRFYAGIAQGLHPHLSGGATIMPAYFADRQSSGLEPYVGQVMRPAKDVIVDFGNGTRREMVVYDDGIFIHTTKMMHQLTAYLERENIRFVQKKVASLDALDGSVIINCSGMGAAELNTDRYMESVQGHLIMLKDQNPEDLQYMLLVYLDKGKTSAGQSVQRSFYFFPKNPPSGFPDEFGVIGGTFVENATIATPNNEEFEIMLEGAKAFYGISDVP